MGGRRPSEPFKCNVFQPKPSARIERCARLFIFTARTSPRAAPRATLSWWTPLLHLNISTRYGPSRPVAELCALREWRCTPSNGVRKKFGPGGPFRAVEEYGLSSRRVSCLRAGFSSRCPRLAGEDRDRRGFRPVPSARRAQGGALTWQRMAGKEVGRRVVTRPVRWETTVRDGTHVVRFPSANAFFRAYLGARNRLT